MRDGLTLHLAYGYYDLNDAYGAGYSFADVTLTRDFGAAALKLAFHDTFGDADLLFHTAVTGPRYVVSLDYEFGR